MDASDIVKDATNLCSLFSEVVEWVGPKNIVQLVTDNVANYKKVGELLQTRFNNIYWSPCAAHCLNLILKDLGSMPLIEDLAKKASKVTIFAYNHIYVLAWLRKRPDFWVLDEESPPDLALEELETDIYEEAAIPVVEEANIASTHPTPGELENEGDGDDIIDFNDLGAFVAAYFGEAGHEDLNYEDSFHDSN
ncbi:hypothetical protein KFK09_017840 [Dendrobium nobile]|uniref:DUF659 domain-containing protein n=1 Tax=Dendrobium nobile TaxID=94219 RepID=A0A8T3AV79_DENNO|nr:hypothetical protein KFK09_017840 [Dendrobium nobile]